MAGIKRKARKVVRKALGVQRRRPQVTVPGDNPAAEALRGVVTAIPQRRRRPPKRKGVGVRIGRGKRGL
jgi:hypothetical protein